MMASLTEPVTMERVFPSMASTVTMRLVDPGAQADVAMANAEQIVLDVARTCTRFDPTSDLMRANDAGRRWSEVDPICLEVIERAHQAYDMTDGRFDPRTLESLVALGYDRTWESIESAAGAKESVGVIRGDLHRRSRVRRWKPRFDYAASRVRVGSRPIDLGGIGKGVAVAKAISQLRGHGQGGLVEAGGDLAVFGTGPQGPKWRVSVEDPFGGTDPVAVLEVTDTAVATSSVRRRTWTNEGSTVHHLIDPRTGRPAESGLRSVSVVHPDAATAEVWTKVGFLSGRNDIRSLMDSAGLPAIWVGDDGRVSYSRAATPLIIWKVSRVRESK